MKKLLIAPFFLLLFSSIFSQSDSAKKATFLLRPYAETGVAFIQNSYLKSKYGTNTMFYWGGGLRLGNPLIHNLLPYGQYTRAAYALHKATTGNQVEDTILSIQEISAGLVFPIKRMGVQMLRAKAAVTYAKIRDGVSKNSADGNGLQLGLGWEGRLQKLSRVYIDYSYDLIKYGSGTFRDYDLGKLTIGIVL